MDLLDYTPKIVDYMVDKDTVRFKGDTRNTRIANFNEAGNSNGRRLRPRLSPMALIELCSLCAFWGSISRQPQSSWRHSLPFIHSNIWRRSVHNV